MPAAAWMLLAITALIVAAAALGLFRVVLHLRAVHQSLTALAVGVEVVAERTGAVPAVVPSVNASLKPVRDFCESI